MDSATTAPNSTALPPYQPLAGSSDASLSLNGSVRPEWADLYESIGRHGKEGLKLWSDRAAHISRERGLAYNPNALEENAQPWSVDPIPWVVSSERWAVLEAGISQRLRLFSLLIKDLYGPQRMFKEGLVPIEILLSQPGFLRSLHNFEPNSNSFGLGMTAFDLVRDFAGRAVVVNDRFDVPNGLGLALENRTIVNKVLPNLFRRCGIRRIGEFYADWFEHLTGLAKTDKDPLVVMLDSLRELNPEISFIANYCGITRLYPSDLTVRNGQAWIKSLKGLLPVDVVWRAVPGQELDSLESDRPVNGVAGLFEAMRSQNVVVANHPGAAALQTDGLYPFLPGLCRSFLGEDLLIPSANTWWCGQPDGLSYVLANLNKMVIKSVCNSHLFGSHYGRLMSTRDRQQIEAKIRANPNDFVGQEEISVSTVPAISPQGLVPRKAVMRTFAFTKQNDDIAIMPGGSARLANSKGLGYEAESKDVWVRSHKEENSYSIASVLSISGFRAPDIVASRTGENLYWSGRYAERVALASRIASRIIDCRCRGISTIEGFEAEHETFLIRSLFDLYECPADIKGLSNDECLRKILTDPDCPASIVFNLNCLNFATNATHEEWSPVSILAISSCCDLWTQAVNDHSQTQTFYQFETALDSLKLNLAAFLGLNLDSMTRDSAWALLDSGRRIERGSNISGLLHTLIKCDHQGDMSTMANESILYLMASVRTYQSSFYKKPQTNLTTLLLLGQRDYPKSLSNLLERMLELLKMMPEPVHQEHPRNLVVTMNSKLIEFVVELYSWQKNGNQNDWQRITEFLEELIQFFRETSNNLTTAYFSHAESNDE